MTARTATAAHTPGPWEVSDVDSFRVQCSGRGELICATDIASEKNRAESVANARLIAAAPDFLAALKAFMRAPSTGSDGPGSLTIVVQEFNLREARDAIARAEGRQP